ncbi:hypothetical protein ESA94_15340 [Lacibacter luteus]|uniref:Uncharacterized protein n=1 Tax=Lacibacter luteus TaxID=2508719 RepID=A0A4Q1CFH3_9BACT|nr:hypothetical protein [Lacibacter luteus]RXK58762.1 hypothetical protein ESA94_15340 [Lacibacter luteus]
MKTFNPEELIKAIDNIDIIRNLPNEYIHEKTVLGIDIYKYSQYPLTEQVYVPVIFEKLYKITAANVIKHENFLFNSYGKKINDFKDNFISTGDGGFQIFDNPLQALVFALYFQANVKRYSAGGNVNDFLKKLHYIVNSIELRYAITQDFIYSFEKNFYGSAIINNARILSRDSLNRLLLDSKSISWFTDTINSVENLMDLDRETFLLTTFFKDYDKTKESVLFEDRGSFKSVDVLKIGQIEAKTTTIDVYNLYVQALIRLIIEKHEYNNFLITLGNLNTSGIS